MKKLVGAVAIALAGLGALSATTAQAQNCSVWLVESSRFMNVPFGAFMPDRAYVPGSTSPNNNINTVDLPVNVGVIKCGKELILYDSGWKAAGLPEDDGHRALGAPAGAAEDAGLRRRSGDQDRRRPRPLGSRRSADGLSQCGAVHPARRVEGHRVGVELPEPEDQRGQHLAWWLHAHARLRLSAEDPGRDLRQGAVAAKQ